jgi:hypothetical protein
MMSSTTRLTATALLGGGLLSIAVPTSPTLKTCPAPRCSLLAPWMLLIERHAGLV